MYERVVFLTSFHLENKIKMKNLNILREIILISHAKDCFIKNRGKETGRFSVSFDSLSKCLIGEIRLC